MKNSLRILSSLMVLTLVFSSCNKDEEDYLTKADVQNTNGYVKGTLKGTLKDGTTIDESLNLTFSDKGNNRVSKVIEYGVTSYNFDIYNSSDYFDKDYYSDVSFDISGNSIYKLTNFNMDLSRILEDNKVLSARFSGVRDLGLSDFVYDKSTHKVSGRINGEVTEGYYGDSGNKLRLDLEFSVEVWEEL